MKKKVEIEVDLDLVDEAIQRFRVADAREAVNLALRTLLREGAAAEEDAEYDEFSDLNAWQPRRSGESG
ncbi:MULTISPECIES: type II toxin-antitoxin system VapB family antitoxin [Mycobacterium]|uniref:type II toxin-antitoxin system VapB family antitoxin n=1 Tax=Mycobacterium TaxID=1763 RepID=UPI001CD9EB50|nr:MULTISPECIES: type II toxin-antitoxin system VapB family antitoxin [Mycobacterium]MCA2243739.1 type II toxin-antitoxin system VapB family antitoxin [Mycobacterium sp. WUMAC-067]MCA2315115.1 type II toxin-antitoxin system VapB family antitoxin [Mycobacterium sp. WUMAC-025]MEE3751148.1 type II toxin-antitoxin system VapB family antitoxin [Mycobacterium intracellulare]